MYFSTKSLAQWFTKIDKELHCRELSPFTLLSYEAMAAVYAASGDVSALDCCASYSRWHGLSPWR